MLDAQAGILQTAIGAYLADGRIPAPIGNAYPTLLPYQIFQTRTQGIGILSAEDAIAYSTSGPTLRGSGVKYDIRRAHPYGIYPELDFDIPVGTVGDCADRYIVRIHEMEQSRRIILQCLDRLFDQRAQRLDTLLFAAGHAGLLHDQARAQQRVAAQHGRSGHVVQGVAHGLRKLLVAQRHQRHVLHRRQRIGLRGGDFALGQYG